jgi:transposase
MKGSRTRLREVLPEREQEEAAVPEAIERLISRGPGRPAAESPSRLGAVGIAMGRMSRLIPPAKSGGNKRTVDVREVMNGVMYVLSTGCQWRALPKDLPPKSTVHDYLILWSCDGTLDRIHHALYVACREQAEREASPTAAIIDSQSVKSAEKGGPASIRMAMMLHFLSNH